MEKVKFRFLALLLVPSILLVSSLLLKMAIGPYWLATNFDPSYLYLVNGLHLLKGVPPNDACHPGTPLQILCGVICWLFNAGQPVSTIARHVFQDPEFYLNGVFAVITAFVFLTSWALGWYVYRKSGDALAGILAQLPVLCFLTLKSWASPEPVLPVLANVSPEPLLTGVVNLLGICLFMHFFGGTSKAQSRAALLAGLAAGLGTAVKFTFAPLVLAPLIIFSWKDKCFFIVTAAFSFLAWTLPAFAKYRQVTHFVTDFFSHNGAYLDPQQGSVFRLSDVLYYWGKFIGDEPAFAACLLTALLVLLWTLAAGRRERISMYLLAVIAGITAQVCVVTKNYGAHYLVPALGFFGPLLVFFYWHMASRAFIRKIILAAAAAGVVVSLALAGSYRANAANFIKGMVSFHEQMASKYNHCIFLDYYRSSSIPNALFFGDGWNGEFQFRDELYQVYPTSFFLRKGGDCRISNFKQPVFSNELLAHNPCLLLRGDGVIDFDAWPFTARLLDQGPFESIHVMTSTMEAQASLLMMKAAELLQEGEDAKSLEYALMARKLHFQPAGLADGFIRQLTAAAAKPNP